MKQAELKVEGGSTEGVESVGEKPEGRQWHAIVRMVTQCGEKDRGRK